MKRPIRIGFVVEGLDVGGTELSLMKWLRHCDRRKFEPLVFAFRGGVLENELKVLGIPVSVIEKRAAFDAAFFGRLVSEFKKARLQLVHCRNGIPAICYGVVAARLAGLVVVSSIHGRTHYLQRGLRTTLWFWVLRWNHRVITVTEGIKKEIARLARISEKKIRVIHNGIDIDGGELFMNRADLRRETGVNEHDFVIGSVGNLRPIKGHKYLVEAFAVVKKRLASAKLVLVGKGEEEDNLRRQASELGVADAVIFLGFRTDASKLIRAFDVFVLPSLSEGFPNVVLEAAAAKVPIVASRVGGMEEILTAEESGLLVEPKSAEEIAGQIRRLAMDKPLVSRLTERAYRTVVERFGMARMLARYDEEYESLRK